jgi:hypothetical protein
VPERARVQLHLEGSGSGVSKAHSKRTAATQDQPVTARAQSYAVRCGQAPYNTKPTAARAVAHPILITSIGDLFASDAGRCRLGVARQLYWHRVRCGHGPRASYRTTDADAACRVRHVTRQMLADYSGTRATPERGRAQQRGPAGAAPASTQPGRPQPAPQRAPGPRTPLRRRPRAPGRVLSLPRATSVWVRASAPHTPASYSRYPRHPQGRPRPAAVDGRAGAGRCRGASRRSWTHGPAAAAAETVAAASAAMAKSGTVPLALLRVMASCKPASSYITRQASPRALRVRLGSRLAESAAAGDPLPQS